jgi:hypothetical protein
MKKSEESSESNEMASANESIIISQKNNIEISIMAAMSANNAMKIK